MTLHLTLITREGDERQLSAQVGEAVDFGRQEATMGGTIPISASKNVSRAAFSVFADPSGMCSVICRQSSGALEVRRRDGAVAAVLRRSERGLFHAPVQLVLHTADGAYATVIVASDLRTGEDRTGARADPRSTRLGWSVQTIENPPPGLDWYVAAALAAVLLRQGRAKDPAYNLPRALLLRACGIWLGAPKSEGWLASKFRQAGSALATNFEANPSHQLGEYVLQNGLLSSIALSQIETEYHRRRAG